ncbi:hypothetical protein GCM10011378_28230 [Hymenobacter glacieicola]|uniref:Glycosyltransferase RgtA/B/C/D-like domain-containing protein n=2 Tax=Hymenobacter glacieicola TaxID=1562124 RepID=A0ABQ1WY80_9BACT|nr:hypothetical protein GCM10011378_28230 [Hymenobacter glacieicola]
MESRNFVAAREMVAGGSWLIPTLNGELRLAKPPLPTWAVAGLQQLTGPTQQLAVLRLPAALAATLLVFFFWGLARELTRSLEVPAASTEPGRTAWFSALVLASSLLVVTIGREGQWDIFTHSLMIGSLWLLARGWQQAGKSVLPFIGAGLLVGLSLLSKGPVAVYTVLFPFLGAYLIGQPQHRHQVVRQAKGTGVGALVGVIVAGSWPLYIWLAVAPAALGVARTEIASWGERHVQPLWYYWSFFAFTGLWALVSLASLVVPYARPRASRFIPYLLALGWLGAGLVLLSVVPEKKERYMLPLMPPLALLIAGLLRHWDTANPTTTGLTARLSAVDKRVVRGWGILLAAVFLALPVLMVFTHLPGFSWPSGRLLVGAFLFLSLVGWVSWQGVGLARSSSLVGASVVGGAVIICLLMPAFPVWEARKGTLGLRRLADVRQGTVLLGLRSWRSLDTMHVKQVWAAGRAIPIWHPTIDSLVALRHPVAVFAASPPPERLPTGWDNYVRVIRLDSFYLGREASGGYWFVSRIDPINTPVSLKN